MVSRKTVLETNLKLAGFACAGVGKGQDLLAAPDGTGGFLLVCRVTTTGVPMLLQQALLVAVACGFDGG